MLSLSATAMGAQNLELRAVGPVEAANCASHTVRVLGITYHVAPSQAFAELCSVGSAAGYKYISISGTEVGIAQASALHWSLIESEPYVAGVSNIYVRGRVSALNAKTGEFRIAGSQTNFITNALPGVNDFVEVLGTQPSPRGVVLVGSVSSRVGLDGIIGSGLATNGIIGSGIVSSGIIGSGKSTDGIIGSGQATSGIIGSGIATNGIIGSGKNANGIIGSGQATSAIIGSGAATNGIIGSGKTTSGIIGSGVNLDGIIGSGNTTSGIIGSGIAINGIIGSGKSAQ